MKILLCEKAKYPCLTNHNLEVGEKDVTLAVYEEEAKVGGCDCLFYDDVCSCPPEEKFDWVCGAAFSTDKKRDLSVGDTDIEGCWAFYTLRSNSLMYSSSREHREANRVTPDQAMAMLREEVSEEAKADREKLEKMAMDFRKKVRSDYKALVKLEKRKPV